MSKRKVLFVCIHNSARSQMAEAFLNDLVPDQYEALSAGIDPGKLNPVVVEVMKELEIDISNKDTKSVQSLIDQGKTFDYLITVCDETSAKGCPVFPGEGERIHMSFSDPSAHWGTKEDNLSKTRTIRDEIKLKIETWVQQNKGH